MTRPCYFVVAGHLGHSVPMLFWDWLPRQMPRGVEYVVRLDTLPHADRLTQAPLAELFSTYRELKRQNRLPPRWEGK